MPTQKQTAPFITVLTLPPLPPTPQHPRPLPSTVSITTVPAVMVNLATAPNCQSVKTVHHSMAKILGATMSVVILPTPVSPIKNT